MTSKAEVAAEKLRTEINRMTRRISNETGDQAKFDELEAKLMALQDAYALT